MSSDSDPKHGEDKTSKLKYRSNRSCLLTELHVNACMILIFDLERVLPENETLAKNGSAHDFQQLSSHAEN
jgi:hypothetical protein